MHRLLCLCFSALFFTSPALEAYFDWLKTTNQRTLLRVRYDVSSAEMNFVMLLEGRPSAAIIGNHSHKKYKRRRI